MNRFTTEILLSMNLGLSFLPVLNGQFLGSMSISAMVTIFATSFKMVGTKDGFEVIISYHLSLIAYLNTAFLVVLDKGHVLRKRLLKLHHFFITTPNDREHSGIWDPMGILVLH